MMATQSLRDLREARCEGKHGHQRMDEIRGSDINAFPSKKRGLCSEFGKIVIERFDATLRQLRVDLYDSSNVFTRQFIKYLDSIPVDERPIKIAQEVLEAFLHDLMAAIDSSKIYTICTMDSDGTTVDLKEVALVVTILTLGTGIVGAL